MILVDNAFAFGQLLVEFRRSRNAVARVCGPGYDRNCLHHTTS